MNQPNIVIKEADKGGAVTVLSKHHYRAMIYQHLSNQNTYQKLAKNLDPTIIKKLKKILNKHTIGLYTNMPDTFGMEAARYF